MRWLWVIHRVDDGGDLYTEWVSDIRGFFGGSTTPTLIETDRLVVYTWHGDTRFLIREDLLPVGWKEVYREGMRR